MKMSYKLISTMKMTGLCLNSECLRIEHDVGHAKVYSLQLSSSFGQCIFTSKFLIANVSAA